MFLYFIAAAAALAGFWVRWNLLPKPRARAGDLCILLVGDENDDDMYELERKTGRLLLDAMRRHYIPPDRLPVCVFHWNNDKERGFCEQNLGIRRHDLFLVAVAEHENLDLRKIVWSEARVSDAVLVAGRAIHQAHMCMQGQEAAPVRVTGASLYWATMCQGIVRGQAVGVTTTYGARDTFYLYALVDRMREGTIFECQWVANGHIIRKINSQDPLFRKVAVRNMERGDIHFELMPVPLWQPGDYEAHLSIDGRVGVVLKFNVSVTSGSGAGP